MVNEVPELEVISRASSSLKSNGTTNETISIETVVNASERLSEIISQYVQSATIVVEEVNQDAVPVASLLKTQISDIGTVLAAQQEPDAPEVQIVTDTFTLSVSSRTAENVSAAPFVATSNGTAIAIASVPDAAKDIPGVNASVPIEAVMWTSTSDLHGTGSSERRLVAGATVSFTLVQAGNELVVRDLAEPVQLTVPLDSEDTYVRSCLGQPDVRQLAEQAISGEPPCTSTLECRYWVEETAEWSTDGCVTVEYNGTETDGAALGCSCSHLSDFVSIQVPTDNIDAIDYGQLDVSALTTSQVDVTAGGMWMSVRKTAAAALTFTKRLYLAYTEADAEPLAWHVRNTSCRDTPRGGYSAASCSWLGVLNTTGNLSDSFLFSLGAAGLRENRAPDAYAASIGMALEYVDGGVRELIVPLHVAVEAVGVAARSTWGGVDAAGSCANTSYAAAARLSASRIELWQALVVPASVCDCESLPVDHETPDESSDATVTASLWRWDGTPTGNTWSSASVAYVGGARYDVALVLPAVGTWGVQLFLGGETIDSTLNVTVVCPVGQEVMPDGESCGCAAGTVLRSGVVPGAPAQTEVGEGLCEPCPIEGTSSELGGACDICAAGWYRLSDDTPAEDCNPCPEWAICAEAGNTLATLQLLSGYWRISNKSSDVWPCASGGNNSSPCEGGSDSGVSGEGYCIDGHAGALCEGCTQDEWYYSSSTRQCAPCSGPSGPIWASRVVQYGVPVICTILPFVLLAWLLKRCRPDEWYKTARLVRRSQVTINSLGIVPKTKVLFSFYLVVSPISDVYRVTFPAQYTDWTSIFSWIDDFNLDLFVPIGCVTDARGRLLVAGLLPLGIVAFCALVSMGWRTFQHVVRFKLPRNQLWRDAVKPGLLRVLPTGLFFTFVCCTSVSTQVFSMFDCRAFGLDDFADPPQTVSYLVSSPTVRCDTSDDEYRRIRDTAVVMMLLWPIGVPLVYFVLLVRARRAISRREPTPLSRACQFLWREYESAYCFYEPIQLLRKCALTGFVLLIPDDRDLGRLLCALLVTITCLSAEQSISPFHDKINSHLHTASQVLLLVLYLGAMLVKLCDDDDAICKRYGFDDSSGISFLLIGFNFGLLSVVTVLLVRSILTSSQMTVVRIEQTGEVPALTLTKAHMYHIFLSHTWLTGQDQVAVIKRQLQLLMPGILVFLDVDDLEGIDKLEEYIGASALIMFFLSRNYFNSRNCLREIRAALSQQKPLVLMHEYDPAKGGLPLRDSRDECPENMQAIIFDGVPYTPIVSATGEVTFSIARANNPPGDTRRSRKTSDDLMSSRVSSFTPRFKDGPKSRFSEADRATEVIAWHRIRDFQLLSLKLLCQRVLKASPLYGGVVSKGAAPPSSSRKSLPTDLVLPGEILTLQLSCKDDHVWLFCSPQNPACRSVGREIARQIDGVHVVTKAPWAHDPLAQPDSHNSATSPERTSGGRSNSVSGRGEHSSTSERLLEFGDRMRRRMRTASRGRLSRNRLRTITRSGSSFTNARMSVHFQSQQSDSEDFIDEDARVAMLLYLNEQTFVGAMGDALAQQVRETRAAGIGIVLAHENDVSKGGGPFARLFQTTPKDLVDDGLYHDIAIALYDGPHRAIGVAMLGQALGARSQVGSSRLAKLLPWRLPRDREYSETSRSPRSPGSHDSNQPGLHHQPAGTSVRDSCQTRYRREHSVDGSVETFVQISPESPPRSRFVRGVAIPMPWGGHLQLGGQRKRSSQEERSLGGRAPKMVGHTPGGPGTAAAQLAHQMEMAEATLVMQAAARGYLARRALAKERLLRAEASVAVQQRATGELSSARDLRLTSSVIARARQVQDLVEASTSSLSPGRIEVSATVGSQLAEASPSTSPRYLPLVPSAMGRASQQAGSPDWLSTRTSSYSLSEPSCKLSHTQANKVRGWRDRAKKPMPEGWPLPSGSPPGLTSSQVATARVLRARHETSFRNSQADSQRNSQADSQRDSRVEELPAASGVAPPGGTGTLLTADSVSLNDSETRV